MTETCSLYERPSLEMAAGNKFCVSPLAKWTYMHTILKEINGRLLGQVRIPICRVRNFCSSANLLQQLLWAKFVLFRVFKSKRFSLGANKL